MKFQLAYRVHESLNKCQTVNDYHSIFPRGFGHKPIWSQTNTRSEGSRVLLMVHDFPPTFNIPHPKRLPSLSHLHQLIHGSQSKLKKHGPFHGPIKPTHNRSWSGTRGRHHSQRVVRHRHRHSHPKILSQRQCSANADSTKPVPPNAKLQT